MLKSCVRFRDGNHRLHKHELPNTAHIPQTEQRLKKSQHYANNIKYKMAKAVLLKNFTTHFMIFSNRPFLFTNSNLRPLFIGCFEEFHGSPDERNGLNTVWHVCITKTRAHYNTAVMSAVHTMTHQILFHPYRVGVLSNNINTTNEHFEAWVAEQLSASYNQLSSRQ